MVNTGELAINIWGAVILIWENKFLQVTVGFSETSCRLDFSGKRLILVE